MIWWWLAQAQAACLVPDLGGVAVDNIPPAGPWTPPSVGPYVAQVDDVRLAAAAFSTGACHAVLTEVRLVGSGGQSDVTVTLHEEVAGEPGAVIEVLGSFSWDGTWAPRLHTSVGVLLLPFRRYQVVVAGGSPATSFQMMAFTPSVTESGRPGWKIGDDHLLTAGVGATWVPEVGAAWMTVVTAAPPDSDGDRVPDPDDVCAGDDVTDSDADGVADGCDRCPADNPDDPDDDGVCTSDDLCPGDDRADADGDAVPDACDQCRGDDALGDPDGDGLCGCPDGDGDGVCDASDLCAGDDRVDGDGDGAPDACDPCPVDNPDDTDGDGICDAFDLCAGDDTVDSDGDGTPDACDPYPDDPDDGAECPDVDADDVCDEADLCAGDDGSGDEDGDGFCATWAGGGVYDCDDAQAEVHPGAEERCDGADSDCDGALPEVEEDQNRNGVPDCTCQGPDCRPDFVDDQGSWRCAVGPRPGWALLLVLAALRRRRR